VPKTYEELATEITISWIKAVGDGVASGKVSCDWLRVQPIKDIYNTAYKLISEPPSKE
jgi:hypothetical protein